MNTGIFGEGFPYSNFHDLNMDWIIKIAKDFLDQYTHIQEIIEQGKEDIETLTESGITQIGDLTATSLQDLQDKKDALEALLQQWYDTHSEDIANQLADALADLNDWYTTHQNYLNQTLAENIAEFNSRADAKATQTIASIPSDYSAVTNLLDNSIANMKNGMTKLTSIFPIIYGLMKQDNTMGNRLANKDYKVKVFDVTQNKTIIINGTTANGANYYEIMFLKSKTIEFDTALPVSDIDAGMLNTDIDSSATGNSVTFVNYLVPIPSDCNYVLIQDYNNNLEIYGEVDIFSEIVKTKELPHTRFSNSYYNRNNNSLSSATGYECKMYDITGLNRVYIQGGCRGTPSVGVACFLTDILGTGTMIVAPSASFPAISGASELTLNQPVEVPTNAKYLIVSSYVDDNNSMTVFSCKSIHNINTYYAKKINCAGDSLTMGATSGGEANLHPYSETLKKLLGSGQYTFIVENNGIGGEKTLEIASRLNGLCAVTGADITIPYNREWIDLPSIKSIYNTDQSLTILRQGTALQGVYANGFTDYRNYYVWIKGIRMTLAYWSGAGYKLVRAKNALDTNSIFVPAGEPIIFERTMSERENACNIIWTGVNDTSLTDIVDKIKSILSYYNNQNYIILGVHNVSQIIFTDEIRSEYQKAFGVRFFDVDKYTRTSALADCGITPTTADTTAISNGLCPPSLLAEGVHFIASFYDALANKLYDKLKQINVIDY